MEYDRYASAIAGNYVGFAGSLIADYLGHTSAGRGVDAVGSFRLQGLARVATLMQVATTLTNDYLAHLGDGARADAQGDPWLPTLNQIAVKNVNDLIVKLMGGGARPADVLTRPAGAVGRLLQQRIERPRLTARDRAGRAWPAEKLVATSARHFAYQAYLDSAIERFDDEGVEWVQVVYANPEHPQHGLTVRLDEIGLIRKSIFHPNSHARLEPHVQA